MIARPARSPCGARPARPLAVHATHPARPPHDASTRLAFCGCSMRRWATDLRPLPSHNELRSAHHRQTSARPTPPDLRAAHPARLPCGASTRLAFCGCSMRRWAAARPRDRHTRALRLGMIDLEARPGPAAAHRHRSHNPRRPHTTHQSGRRPPAPPQARTTGSQRDKTLPAQHISRSNGTKFSLLVVKRSFWPVLRMQGEFYPGYDIHGPQQGEFYPGILVAHGPHPGSAMIIHVLLARQRP